MNSFTKNGFCKEKEKSIYLTQELDKYKGGKGLVQRNKSSYHKLKPVTRP